MGASITPTGAFTISGGGGGTPRHGGSAQILLDSNTQWTSTAAQFVPATYYSANTLDQQ